MTPTTHKSKRGFFTFEIVGCLVLLSGFLLAAATFATRRIATQDRVTAQTDVVLAAEAALNMIRADGDFDSEQFAKWYPDVRVSVTDDPGQGVWTGMTRITVRTEETAMSGSVARYSLDGHVPEAKR